MRARVCRIPSLDRRESAALQEAAALDAVAAALDHIRNDVVGLLGKFNARLRHPTIIERIGLQCFDLGENSRVVGLLGVELVAAEHLDADLLRLLLKELAMPTP